MFLHHLPQTFNSLKKCTHLDSKEQYHKDIFFMYLQLQVLLPLHPCQEWKMQRLGEWKHWAHCRRRPGSRPRNVNIHMSMGPNEINLQVLRELADKAAKPLSIISEKNMADFCLQPRRQMEPWTASKGEVDWSRWFSPPPLLLRDPTSRTVYSSVVPKLWSSCNCWIQSRVGPSSWQEDWRTFTMKPAWERWGCSACRTENYVET